VRGHRLVAEPAVDLDVEAAFDWYQDERAGLGLEFLDELRAAYAASSKGRSSTSNSGGALILALVAMERRSRSGAPTARA
jgi:hypothetical protein